MPRHPKIAIVANSTWNVYNFRMPLIKVLKLAGYRVVVIAPVDQYIHYLSDSYFTKHIPLKHMHAQRRNAFSDLRLFLELSRIYRREKPDLVLHFTAKPNIYGSLAASLAGVPSVPTVTGLGYPFMHGGWKNKLIRPLYARAFRRLPHVIFHNAEDRALFERERLIRKEQGMVVDGSGVDMDFFSPAAPSEEKRFIFLFAGRLLTDKGIREFVAAARHLRHLARQAEFWVVGELNTGNPARVSKYEVLGWVSEKVIRYFGHARDIRRYLRDADVLVLPSYREGLPRSILEAMSMAKPVITTHTAGCRQTVEPGENGFLVAPRDEDDLAEAMLRMYQLDRPKLRAMGRRSQEMVRERFDVRIITDQYLQLIRQILNPNQDARSRKTSDSKIL